MNKYLWNIFFVLITVGCSTRNIEMYTLDSPGNISPSSTPYSQSVLRIDYPKGIEDTMGTRIYYSRSDLTQSYYRYNQWSKPLNRILMAYLIETLQRSHTFKTVLDYASEANADYILESTIYRFRHRIEGEQSYADISIGLRLLRSSDLHLVKSRRFDYRIPCKSTDARGFVKAADEALKRLSADMLHWLIK